MISIRIMIVVTVKGLVQQFGKYDYLLSCLELDEITTLSSLYYEAKVRS